MELPQEILNLSLDAGAELTEEPESKEQKPLRMPPLRVITEKRRGKQVTIIWSDNRLTDQQARQLAKELKQHLAVGGSMRDGEILLQGNVKDKVQDFIRNKK